jgi:RimJ/RimL family protein N-acetyltransferase
MMISLRKLALFSVLKLFCCACGILLTSSSLEAALLEPIAKKAPPAEVKGLLVTLKWLQEDDFEATCKMMSSAILKALEFPDTTTSEDIVKFLKGRLQRAQAGKFLVYSIFDNKDQTLIGSIEVRDRDDDEECLGLVGCWINENYWGGGRYMETLKLLADIYFDLHPEAESVTNQIELWNVRSYKAALKYGCTVIGYHYNKDGQPDRYFLKYTREQHEQLKKRIFPAPKFCYLL